MKPKLTVTTPSDREIAMTRTFDAPRSLVFEAMTTPAFLKRWLLGPEGWTMTHCEFAAHPGGRYRYEWQHAEGATMAVGGTILEIVPPEKIVATEQFDESWYPGEATLTTTFEATNGQTTVRMSIQYDTREARDAVLKSPMETGVAASYNRLAQILQEG